jgi:RNAse (barnase) inhibitor barstar
MIDPKVKEKLWEMVKGEVEVPLTMFLIKPGIKPNKGQTKPMATLEAVMEVCKNMYEAGLECGYDMAKEVFDGN